MKKTQKATDALVAELRKAKAEKKSMLEASKAVAKATVEKTQVQAKVAKNASKATETKVREVKDFISKDKTHEDLQKDTRAVIRQERSYMIEQKAQDNFSIYNRTMFRNDKNELELFTQAIANAKVDAYVQERKKDDKFKASDIIRILHTCGGAYGDKIRKHLYAISYYATEINAESIKSAREHSKLCIYHNINSDSARKIYEFTKL